MPVPLFDTTDLQIDPTEDAGRFAPHPAPEQAMDGSPAARPGDPAPAPRADGAPLFSTDPLGEE